MKNRLSYLAMVGVGQAAAFVAGIVVVRSMSKENYAAYAAAFSAISAAVVISDSGTASVLMARLASHRHELEHQIDLMRGALAVRRRTAVVIVIGLELILSYVLVNLHLPIIAVGAILAVVALTVSNSLLRSLLIVDLQIRRRFNSIVGAEAVVNLARLSAVVVVVLISARPGPSALVVLLITLTLSYVQTGLIRRSSILPRKTRMPDRPSTSEFRNAVRSTVPWTILMVCGDQFVNVLLTINANSQAIAEIGALTRYAMALTVLNNIIGNVLASNVAHAARDDGALLAYMIRIGTGGFVVATLYIASCWFFRSPLLATLGAEYSHLESAFLVLSLASALQFLTSYVLGVFVHARGWVQGNWIFGPVLVVWALWALTVLKPTDSLSAAWLVLGLQVPAVISQSLRLVLGMRRDRMRASITRSDDAI